MLSRRLFASSLAVVPAFPGALLAQPAAPLPVVATFSILADMTQRVGGERVAVSALVGPDGDAHTYAPTPADARTLAAAKAVMVNGLGFEGWLTRLIRSSGTRAPVTTAAAGITPLKAPQAHRHGHGHGHGHGHRHDHGADDPHAWHDAALAKIYVRNILAGLSEADAEGRAAYEANAASYLAELDALDAEIKAAVAGIPAERRRVLSTHDAFRYFSRAYGIDFVAVRGVSSDAEPSARQIAAIIRQIKQRRIAALFMENISDPRAIERIGAETGARIGGQLYSDALSPPGGPAPTYLDLMRHNTRQIVGALALA